jgi:uncharacterized membrane protein YqgA involved in biofilm formation
MELTEWDMLGLGTLVNAAAIVAGSAVGLVSGHLIPKRIRTTTIQAMGLAILVLGLQMALDPRVDAARIPYHGPLPYRPNPLVVIGGLALGSILGELLHLERRLEQLGHRLQALASRAPILSAEGYGDEAAREHSLVEGFVTASLLYCVGAMAVIGAIQDAVGQPQVLFVKAMLDGILSIMLASTLGLGVAFSALPLFLYQGGITLAAGLVAPFLTVPVLATLTATGGLLIAAIGLDLTGIKRLPIGNMLPGVFVAAVLAYFFG